MTKHSVRKTTQPTSHPVIHHRSVHKAHYHEVHRPTAWFVIATIGIIALLSAFAIVLAARTSDIGQKPYPKTPLVGQSLNTNLYSVSVTEAKFVTGEDKAFPVPADKQLLVLSFNVQNKAALPLQFSPSTMTFLRDDEGDEFVMAPSMLLTQPIPGGPIAAGDTRGGQLSYWVPKNLETAKQLKFYFDPRWGDMQPVSFNLGL